ncbi:rhomboid family intramembrane serine protease [Paraglaciecola hydrolytica]|uniref:Rhomboid family intramembrane serine protease n=1 Tax=Paraglaciecola hydrolytica TaxID=1799789 RepID=A0A136A6E3_9ALTE|nr:rhomboid family intramembrane serine protease [Paraglaciecola hydrolytica]KXI30802.1 rhomboid family intramembrane serine protease [Paraglaciecola hydrolytica]
MKENKRFTQCLLYSLFAVSFLWCIKSAQILFHWDLSWMGVHPHEPFGLIGIITAPLVHGSLEHLFNNTLPLIIMSTVLAFGYPKAFWRVLGLIWLVSGLGVWLFAREANHIGASGIAHGLFFFILVASIFRRDKSSVAIMMIVFLLYGGMTMTILPREEHISFEYHFFGAVAGFIAALIWRNRDPKPVIKPYAWELKPDDDPIIGDDWQVSEEFENLVEQDKQSQPIDIKYH